MRSLGLFLVGSCYLTPNTHQSIKLCNALFFLFIISHNIGKDEKVLEWNSFVEVESNYVSINKENIELNEFGLDHLGLFVIDLRIFECSVIKGCEGS